MRRRDNNRPGTPSHGESRDPWEQAAAAGPADLWAILAVVSATLAATVGPAHAVEHGEAAHLSSNEQAANGNLNILANGNIPFSWGTQIVLIDGNTGRMRKHNDLPPGVAAVEDVNYKHLTVAPDRTLIVKCQTRPTGETSQGSMAIVRGVMKGLKQPNSHMCAVDPDTLEVLDDIGLPEATTAPHIINEEDGRIAIYVPTVNFVLRYYWDGETRKLTQDESWIMKPMRRGQETATAPTVVGDWIAVQTNGSPTDKVPSSIAIAHRKDVGNLHIIFPFGELEEGEWSFCPPKPGADPENHMIYSADAGIGKTAGIRLDPETGEMETVFVVPARSTSFQPVVGSSDQRVLLVTNMKMKDPAQAIMDGITSANYREQLTWWDAATGRSLAASDFFEPMTMGALVTPGYGGRIYFPTLMDFVTLQVLPANP